MNVFILWVVLGTQFHMVSTFPNLTSCSGAVISIKEQIKEHPDKAKGFEKIHFECIETHLEAL